MKKFITLIFICHFAPLHAQNFLKNWYFGTGNDGISFVNNIPQKLSDKATGVGFEGMVVVNDPLTGDLLFYSDGQKVIDKNHNIMTNGAGMTGHFSGAQCVQSCPVPGSCAKKFYLFTNSAWDNTQGQISYSIIDFSTNPLGVVTNKNTLFWTGPSDQGMCLVNKPGTNDYWLIANDFNAARYNVWPLTVTGIGAPVTYTFSNTGASYQINYDNVSGKIAVTGFGNKHVTFINFNSATGVLSNEQQIGTQFGHCAACRFSPDGSKFYLSAGPSPVTPLFLYQYDMATAVWTNMNTCCFAHDLKMGPDNKMYFLNSYSSSQPMSVIDFPNASAIANACNYHTLSFTPAFNGEVRRFPETVILPAPPIANTDIVSITGLSVAVPVLNNDLDPQGDILHIDAIIALPVWGTATIVGNNINYTANLAYCGKSDTLIYRIADNNCATDTAMVIVNFPTCTSITCDNWLSTPSQGTFVNVGDLDIPGNQITIEAVINRTQPYIPGTGNNNDGDVVSKHTGPSDINYLLRPNHAFITTTNGFFATPDVCDVELNKTYHIAMVYDGSTLKFYRNGFLMSQVAASGNLFQSNLPTRIGRYTGATIENFIGFTNEVRIWNVARTQSQIRTYMNSGLPTPTVQPGLQAYYTFDNLLNKQGNPAWNGTLGGPASINQTNPSCNFIADSCNALILPPCNFWPKFTPNSYTTTIPNGSLDFSFSNTAHLLPPAAYNTLTPGNWFTPNPTIATTSPPNSSTHNTGDLGGIGIYPVTTNEMGVITLSSPSPQGFYVHVFQTISRIDFDKSFTLISSDGDLHVGNSNSLTGNVLIPDVIESQSPDDANATVYFPPGTSQVNFTLTSSPSSPAGDGIRFAFTFPEDCITATPGISGIINHYTPVLSLDKCKNILSVGDATNYNVGDTVLLIQMKGAVIDSTNTAAFGTVTDYKNAGNYEFNYVKSTTGNTIELKNTITRNYDLPDGKVQLIRVPYYQNATISSTLTCPPWNGSTGGVLVLNAADSVILNADIDVKGKGFRGGFGFSSNLNNTSNCFENEYYYPLGSILSGNKGESIASVSNNKTGGKGRLASGGGAGLDHNGGGGGGANAGAGGFGGYQLLECGNSPFDNRGIGGNVVPYTTTANKIFMGGGGGSGHANNTGTVPAGGNGGGIVIINAQRIKNSAYKIIGNGEDAPICVPSPAASCHDGMGGGGAGGTVLLNISQVINSTTVEEKGGKGADMTGSILGGHIGAGGGGGGGTLWVSSAAPLPNITNICPGGLHGVLTTDNNSTWGATDGSVGATHFNLQVPVDVIPFKINIDSVRFNSAAITCSNFNFAGLAYINGTPVNTWEWYFGDGGTAFTQNTARNYTAAGTFFVKLVVTDLNGCKDSISKPVNVLGALPFDFSYKQDVCNPLSVQFTGAGTSLLDPYWSFGDNSTITGTVTPTHSYPAQGNYLVRFTINNPGCNDTINKIIAVNVTAADIVLTPDTTICFGTTKQLRGTPSANFCWSPTTYLNNPLLNNPITSTPGNITYYYTAEIPGNNLIVNGDFSAGNTGFTSAYNYAPNNTTEGEYFVGPNPVAWNAGTSACVDHTTGNENMMLINGAPTPGSNVWKQTINVAPNTNYNFTCWAQSVYFASPAQLQFSINNILIGPVFSPGGTTCNWQRFFSNWNSGTNATATIAIVNLNTTVGGNDFALDDISFAPVTIQYDSVTIIVDTPRVTAFGNNAVCPGTGTPLNASGASTYSWSPVTGLSNPNIANPMAAPAVTTLYTVNGTTINGCTAASGVTVTVLPKPFITKTPDTAICNNAASVQLFANGGNVYTWSPAATLNNPAIFNPVAAPAATITKYYVTVTNTSVNSCTNTDSITVTRKPLPAFGILPSKKTCEGSPVQLNATGGDIYLWSPAALVTNAVIRDPFTTAASTTNYSVSITESVCNISKTLFTTITINPNPVVTAIKSNDIDCSLGFARLFADGASSYVWTPSKGLSSYTSYNPIAKPDTTTQYIVKGFNSFGCSASDTLTVAVTVLGKSGYYMPNSFTPNGDGKNDCFGLKYWGTVKQLQFIIYNRWGEKVFVTTNPDACWDGNYKSAKADGGNYVYYIKAVTACGPVEKKENVLLIR